MNSAISAYGDGAVKVVVASSDPEESWRTVHRLAASVNDEEFPGLTAAIATYDSVLVEFDPLLLLPDEAHQAVDRALSSVDSVTPWNPGATFEIPVVYGGEHGPDLEEVAAHLYLSPEDLVAAHAATEHVVRCYAHSATAMLDGPKLPDEVPRLPDPRLIVPAGSVLLAGRQAVVLACTQPSGWQVIGRTPVRLTDLSAPTLTAYRPGDRFRYRRIRDEEWEQYADATVESCRA